MPTDALLQRRQRLFALIRAAVRPSMALYYDERDMVKGVEFFERSTVSWSGHKLVGETSTDVLALFRHHGFDPVIDDDGFEVGELDRGFTLTMTTT